MQAFGIMFDHFYLFVTSIYTMLYLYSFISLYGLKQEQGCQSVWCLIVTSLGRCRKCRPRDGGTDLASDASDQDSDLNKGRMPLA